MSILTPQKTPTLENLNDGLLAAHRVSGVVTALHLTHVDGLLVQLTIIVTVVLLGIVD